MPSNLSAPARQAVNEDDVTISAGEIFESAEAATLTLILVRHGVTAWNAEGRLQGQTDIPLSPEGREQARRLADRFRKAWSDSAPSNGLASLPTQVFVSDLSRAMDTATIVTESLDLPASRIHVTPLLRERSFGPWEGLTLEEARIRFGDKRSHRDEGEPHAAVWDRMGEIARHIWSVTTGGGMMSGTALVVGHGGSLRQFACQSAGIEQAAAHHLYLDNTGVSILELKAAGLDQRTGRILLWNDTSHLL